MNKEILIKQVLPEDLPEITDLVKQSWKEYFNGQSEALIDAACGMIARNNYIEPALSFKAVQNDKIVGVVFVGISSSKSHPEEFYHRKLEELSAEDRDWLMRQRKYHLTADEECKKLLGDKTFKLALFISAVKGCGKELLSHVTEIMKHKGFERMALWTDSSCSYDYYPAHGFTQHSSIHIPEYSTSGEDYRLMTFTKGI